MSNLLNCRMCADSPMNIWSLLWGGNSSGAAPAKGKKAPRPTRRVIEEFQKRTSDEIKSCVRAWEQYAHPRAREFFPTREMLDAVLEQLARGIHREDDPVLGDDTKCVYWYGDVTKDDQQAAIKMIKPGETSESITYVNRVLAFIFATDESFDHLMRLPKEPFMMSCGDQLCVNLAHISLQVDSYCPDAAESGQKGK